MPEKSGAEAAVETPPLHVVVLAAGKGTRMRSDLPKVLHRAGGLPLIDWVLRLAHALNPASISVVVGHGAEAVQSALPLGVRAVVQQPQLGTGHALLQARPLLEHASGRVLLLSGDVPLLRSTSVQRLLDHQAQHRAALVVATALVPDPSGYGRIVRDNGHLARIVEHRDATAEERAIREINSGVYVFDLAPLFPALAGLGSANAQGEYYLPDLVGSYRRAGLTVEALPVDDPDEIRGINTRAELAAVAAVLRSRTNAALMDAGVTLVDPATCYVDPDVRVGRDTILHPFVCLEGATTVGAGCEVFPGVRIVDSQMADGVTVFDHSLVAGSTVAAGCKIGPFARIRPGSEIAEQVHIGNFVEIKKAKLGERTKIGHLAYVGDAQVGSDVNIGAGTITCNFDGQKKHQTTIGDGAFVGSDSTLVAPVRIGSAAYVAAGSAITDDVPDGALGIARGRQANKRNWAYDRANARSKST
jgi:bifunctional UDP-N-acetylglucosamine pyrophosphorylase / glucosamine-1-phosphate N-acetyltransferase